MGSHRLIFVSPGCGTRRGLFFPNNGAFWPRTIAKPIVTLGLSHFSRAHHEIISFFAFWLAPFSGSTNETFPPRPETSLVVST